jgi:undecaprenyl-diphosphatase
MPARGDVEEHFVVHPVRAVRLGVVLLGIVVLTALAVPTEPLALDRRWSEAMHDLQTPFLTHVALVFNALGRGLGWALSIVAVCIVLFLRQRMLALVAFAAAEVLTSVSSTVLKALVGRPRPPDGLVHPVGSSFPSGHAAYAGATCIALVLLFSSPGPRRLWWWAAAALGTAGMAWSRTYLQVHWLSDVVGGSLLGIGLCLVVFGVAQRAGVSPRPVWRHRRRGAASPAAAPTSSSGRSRPTQSRTEG